MIDLGSIVGRLEERLGPAEGDPLPLEGGITNRNYRIRLGARDYVVRLPGKDTALLGISRTAECLAGEAAARLGIGPAVAAADESCLVTDYVGGTPLDAAGVRVHVESVARALRAFHDSGTQLPARFWVPELLEDYAFVVRDRRAELPDDYEFARRVAARIADVLPNVEPTACHNDLLPANVLVSGDQRVTLVDWEYAGMGHRMFDLGNLAVNGEFDARAEERLLAAYFDGEVRSARRAALKLMRLMSDAREAAWGVIQGVVSSLDFDFDGYAHRHFERLRAAVRGNDFEDWLRAAAP